MPSHEGRLWLMTYQEPYSSVGRQRSGGVRIPLSQLQGPLEPLFLFIPKFLCAPLRNGACFTRFLSSRPILGQRKWLLLLFSLSFVTLQIGLSGSWGFNSAGDSSQGPRRLHEVCGLGFGHPGWRPASPYYMRALKASNLPFN